ncbi:hypothetical protein BD324DRAFT_652993 [Kockovaella imperatae]|uniref:BZIP domain-containing protein n=1 Tax=Kockovaella imperatae TaxID=4999 RepID=A0A1Y1UCD3_9TREE|nr:hypothetical protein BD324DRAFT_652993 [Kockovaella imperatae]ORX34735.1 hypothetical protein BD324DRAFT_652993 [Kockovaella imperatae]
MSSGTSSDGSNPMKRCEATRCLNDRKKRVITPSRREQNRASQKRWRERRRGNRTSSDGSQSTESPSETPGRQSVGPQDKGDLVFLHADTDHLSMSSALATCSTPSLISGASEPSLPMLDSRNLNDPFSSLFSAMLYNAIALGFDLPRLINCSPTVLSPFYRPLMDTNIDQADLLSSIIAGLPPDLPPSLRPTISQVLFPHHPCLDLIPFPKLRDNVLMVAAAMPHKPVQWSLKLDLYQNGGLQLASMIEKEAPLVSPGGTVWPWEASSWHVEPWFKSKWLLAFGAVN